MYHNSIMRVYMKDNNGNPASCINRQREEGVIGRTLLQGQSNRFLVYIRPERFEGKGSSDVESLQYDAATRALIQAKTLKIRHN